MPVELGHGHTRTSSASVWEFSETSSGSTTSRRNSSTCSGARPTNRRGSSAASRSRDRDAELAVGGQAVEQVVSLGAVLDRARRLDAVAPDALVGDLAIAAGAHGADDQLLGRHERQLVGQAAPDARRMHLESAGDVFHQNENRVGREEAFGNHEPPVRAVVERALEELHAVREVRVRLERDRRIARATRSARSASDCACTPSPTIRSAPSRTAPRSRRPTAARACRR